MEIINGIFSSPGKGLRGKLLTLAAGGEEKVVQFPQLRVLASGIEILHLATLIHDDLLDRGEVRRGRPAVWRKWGDKTAVIIGDYLFATAYRMINTSSGERGMSRVNLLIKEMVEAELEEEKEKFRKISFKRYISRIEKKTARFFQVVCELGAEVALFPREICLGLGEFGRQLGTAYQLFDDLLDLNGEGNNIGKPVFQDLRNGVLTLPLLLIAKQPVFNKVLDQVKADGKVKPGVQKKIKSLLIEERVPKHIWGLIDEYRRRAKKQIKELGLPHGSLLTVFADCFLSREPFKN
ncbi:MAG TPA: hypothetical protein DDZ91_11845 [Firmicutes bacterium]|jgi:heptaprenyl diphosphate synthase|nr:hypothetical protein [Bacillota bacterium]